MVFSIIEDEASAVGIRIKSIFADVAKSIRSAFQTSSGFTFSETFTVSINNDVTALQKYIEKLNSGVTAEQAFAETMRAASAEAQAHAKSLNATTYSTEEAAKAVDSFVVKQKMAQVSMQAQNKNLGNIRVMLNEYNSGMANCGLSQADYITAVSKSNSILGNYLNSLGSSKATMGGYVASLVTAKAATIALQTATMLLNAAFSMLISYGISKVISLISEHKQKLEDEKQALLDAADAAKDEAESIKELYTTYKEADSAYKSNVGSKEDLESATDDLLSALGYEQAQIEDLIAEYGDLSTAIDAVTQKSLEASASKILSAYETAKQEALDAAKDSMAFFSGGDITVSTHGDAKKFAEVLQNAGYLGSGDLPLYSTSLHTGINDYGDFESLAAGYNELLEMQKALEAGVGNLYTAEELAEADVYKSIAARIDSVADQIEAVYEDADSYNDIMAQFAYNDYVNKNGIPETKGQYDELRQSILDSASASGTFLGTQEQIETAIINTLAGIPELASFINNYSEAIGEVEDIGATTLNRAESIKETLVALWSSEAFADTKEDIIDLANELDGITADNIEDLVDSSDDLAELLKEDGMNAQFLAKILQTEALGGDGFSLITESALILNDALDGMAKSFSEVTAAKSRYDQAMSVAEKDEDFKSYAEAFEELNNQFIAGTTNSRAFWAAAEFLFGEDQLQLWGWSDGIDEIYNAMKNSVGIFEDADSAGAGFLDRLNEIAESGEVLGKDGSVIASIEKLSDGSWKFDVDALHLDELADQMGLSKEAIMSCLEALSMWGDVDYYNISEVLDAIKEIGLSTDDFDGTAINVEALTDQLISLGYTNKDIYGLLQDLQAVEGITLVDTNANVETLVQNLESLGIASGEVGDITIDIDGLSSLAEGLGLTKEDAESLITKLYEADGIKMTSAGAEVKTLDDALTALDGKTFTSVTSEIDGITTSAETAQSAVESLQTYINNLTGKTVTITLDVQRKPSILGSLFGYARGTKNAPSGPALTGEDGEELVQSGNRAYFVGSNGPEIVNLNAGDRVYTADETKRIKSGRSISGVMPSFKVGGIYKPEMVTLDGSTAYSSGTTYSGSVGGAYGVSKAGSSSYSSVLSGSSSSGSSGSSSVSSSSAEDEIKTLDWIEIAISRIEQVIDRLKTTATSTYKALKTKLGATCDEISAVNQELEIQQKAYDRYMQEANSVGLSSDLAELVRNGTIDIDQYDQDTQELISDYQNWYESALECSDAILELHENLASLYEDNFDNIQEDFENQISLLEHLSNTYETAIDTLEEKGYLASTKYYAALQEVEQQNINVLNEELTSLQQSFSEAMSSGEIEEYSEAYYSMALAINDVKEQIDEANLSLIEYANTMREIEWEYFDFIQDRISQLTQESDFLIDLMSNSDLYTDKGQFTDTGMATMGLHAMNYDTYMAQANKYAAEILEIDKQLAEDPYNTDLIERREELLSLQQDSIAAAEDEKQAIVDMVEEGINLELGALQDLIDKYTDALDSAKDLYDYQKKISGYTSDIASLQKQLSAYSNDLSEETKAKVQKLQVELKEAKENLQETEYEQYISDQKKLLDSLYDEYEILLNQRLDDVDALLEDMIGTVNSNTDSINATLMEAADSVGYTMTESMQSVWNGATEVLDGTLSVYGDGFNEKLTAINNVLNQIQANTATMIANSNAEAESTTSSTTATAAPTPTTPPSGSSSSSTTSTAPSTSATAKTITVGGQINAQGAKIYSYAGDTNGQNQYFASDPIYTVLKEQDGYLQVRHHTLSSGVTGWFKKNDVKAYKTGGLVDYTGLAQLDGTPSKPELVLNAKDTENFIDLKEYLRQLANRELTIGSGSNIYSNIAPIAHTGMFTDNTQAIKQIINQNPADSIQQSIGDINITIPIEHVEDYNDFVSQLQKDKQFERFIQSMTVDRLVGGSSLKKNKFQFGN